MKLSGNEVSQFSEAAELHIKKKNNCNNYNLHGRYYNMQLKV